MENFWDSSVWGFFHIIATLLVSLLAAHMMKRMIPVLQASLIPASVLGGGILIVIAAVFKAVTGEIMFETDFFGGNGTATLEIITSLSTKQEHHLLFQVWVRHQVSFIRLRICL